LPFGAPP